MRTIKSRTRKTPQQQCQIVHETWGPHAGCAEYMDRPETWQCTSASTHVVVIDNHYPTRDRERMRVCGHHAKGRLDSDEFATVRGIYRYRTV